ncbi:hypothetical protein TcG_01198 [Trypanosoma cruzi]|uniref:WW domain-containing protein n=1 Tax=Trypanosoma cruzi TaxID=5693 RepID=A0A2V2VNU0_TRYCR|nr:hypothetical protein TcBrA4_0004920 [Trypanosoma cruzi]PBJ71848.1 hypothetical protein BCY84_16276 [Trypanosoma cruzi cruzi]PBJ78639.1 hypothetical protein BCY84_04180 [Trypanosoma cruzi cruzi]PWU98011.1 hypothetical protein C4B63_13g1749c [Trypanosoma cruzi]RNF23846.1 hypothetical protein TcG_01198 [Trypanosoma cruzi]
MSRRGFPAHRERSPENVDGRSIRPRTENRMPFAELGAPVVQCVDGMSEEALYAEMCPSDGEPLPPGWEKVVYHGTIVYLDHVAREAHEVRPWEVWQRRSEAAK